MRKTMRCLIAGRVQGVWFRASTKAEADRLGIDGYAKNLPDGRVEVLACGDGDALAELQGWLAHGPRLAEVSDLRCEASGESWSGGFSVL